MTMRLKFKNDDAPPAFVTVGATEVARCGHAVTVQADPNYLKETLAKLRSRDCSSCRAQRVTAEKTAGHDRREGNRLPDGAVFSATYDATRKRWSGTLTINGQVFQDERNGVFGLMAMLDRQYRRSLAPVVAATP